MGDIPRGKQQINTDLLFKPCLDHNQLADELFCQLMKQLTDNTGNYSEERGWELMYLATGVTFPSPQVMREVLEFFRTRPHVLAAECLKRVKRLSAIGRRKWYPCALEVEAIQQRFRHIYHKVRKGFVARYLATYTWWYGSCFSPLSLHLLLALEGSRAVV